MKQKKSTKELGEVEGINLKEKRKKRKSMVEEDSIPKKNKKKNVPDEVDETPEYKPKKEKKNKLVLEIEQPVESSVKKTGKKKTKATESKTGAVVEDDFDETSECTSDKGKEAKKSRKKKKKSKVSDEDGEDTRSRIDRALDYLRTWQNDRSAWKFEKVKQMVLLGSMYDENKVPEVDFEIMLLYLEGLVGKGKEKTLLEAEKKLSAIDEDESEDKNAGEYERIRKVIQTIS